MFKTPFAFTMVLCAALVAGLSACSAEEYESGMKWAEPPIITPGKTDSAPPSDAIILFDGKDLSAWQHGDKWIVKDGVATVKDSAITTKQKFGDCQLHIEWSAPVPAKGSGQGRGNSGVFLMNHYEVQVLDSYENKTYFDGQASAIYKQTPPMVNAMRPPGEWNAYDIIWTAPKFMKDGSLESPAFITVLHNGVVTQNHVEIQGDTFYNKLPAYEKHGKEPIQLQNHGDPVRYRNIWVREIKPAAGEREREPYIHHEDTKTDTPARGGSAVKGAINLDGKPLPAGKVAMHASEGKAVFSGRVMEGKFEVNNLPAGKYIVTVQGKNDGSAKVDVPKKYADKEHSGLMLEVVGGVDDLVLNLNK